MPQEPTIIFVQGGEGRWIIPANAHLVAAAAARSI